VADTASAREMRVQQRVTKEVLGDVADFHLFQNGVQGWHLLVFGDAGVVQELLKLRALSCQVVYLRYAPNLSSGREQLGAEC